VRREVKAVLALLPLIAAARLAYSYSRDTGWLLLTLALAAFSAWVALDVVSEAAHAYALRRAGGRGAPASEVQRLASLLSELPRSQDVVRSRLSRLVSLRAASLLGISPSEAASILEDVVTDGEILRVLKGEVSLGSAGDVASFVDRVEGLKVGDGLRRP